MSKKEILFSALFAFASLAFFLLLKNGLLAFAALALLCCGICTALVGVLTSRKWWAFFFGGIWFFIDLIFFKERFELGLVLATPFFLLFWNVKDVVISHLKINLLKAFGKGFFAFFVALFLCGSFALAGKFDPGAWQEYFSQDLEFSIAGKKIEFSPAKIFQSLQSQVASRSQQGVAKIAESLLPTLLENCGGVELCEQKVRDNFAATLKQNPLSLEGLSPTLANFFQGAGLKFRFGFAVVVTFAFFPFILIFSKLFTLAFWCLFLLVRPALHKEKVQVEKEVFL